MTKCNKVLAVVCGGMIFASCVLAFPCVVEKTGGAALHVGALETQECTGDEYIDFLEGHEEYTVREIVTMYDFSGNEFFLYRLSPIGYAIYDCNGRFIEGSYQGNSPYDVDAEALELGEVTHYYYLGPSNYFFGIEEEIIYEIYEEQVTSYYDWEGASYELGTSYDIDEDGHEVETDIPEGGEDTTEYDGFTLIKEYQFFEKMSKVEPTGYREENFCAVIASAMLLAYLDTFCSDKFIDNDVINAAIGTVSNREYINPAEKVYHSESNTGTTIDDIGIYDFNQSPYCGSYMVQYLCSIRTSILGTGAMTQYHINKLLMQYLQNYQQFDGYFDVWRDSLLYTHLNTRNLISQNVPVLISLTKYTSETETSSSSNKYHTVVAYGYDAQDRFLVHMGYDNKNVTYDKQKSICNSAVILSSATIYSYFGFIYTGDHVHSYNYALYESGSSEVYNYICGCGAKFDSDYNEID